MTFFFENAESFSDQLPGHGPQNKHEKQNKENGGNQTIATEPHPYVHLKFPPINWEV
ncbi:No hit [Brucella canis HSK A52141]|nr:No hit [Brucella canis HSK A52141]